MSTTIERIYCGLDSQPITNATKLRILEISIELFSKRGFSGASIRDITKEVGIKESSLYKHFRNKDEILETIFTNFRRETDKILPPMVYIERIAESMSLKEFLERGVTNFLAHIDDSINQKIWRMMYIELFRNPMAQDIYRNDIMQRTVDCLTAVFEMMIAKGKLPPINARTLATEYQYSSITLVLEYNMLLAEGRSTEHMGEIFREHVEFFAAKAGG